ncbi:Uncharacterised protein [Mycobacteroides abscessus subsp. abscessus]|nr:Uncharacterised protein [Mycobacteroides abscessus subsp. abscessus]
MRPPLSVHVCWRPVAPMFDWSLQAVGRDSGGTQGVFTLLALLTSPDRDRREASRSPSYCSLIGSRSNQ